VHWHLERPLGCRRRIIEGRQRQRPNPHPSGKTAFADWLLGR